MNSLPEVDVRPRYASGVDDILRDFIVPCLQAAHQYSRASGYFSSAVLSLSWTGVRALLRRRGTIRVICSPSLAASDVAAFRAAVDATTDVEEEAALLGDLQRMLDDDHLRDSARALAAMIVAGAMDVRIAIPAGSPTKSPARRIFHQKAGVFEDRDGNAVAFIGSMNETWAGVALHGNVESIQAFASWQGEREALRVYLEQRDFEDLWFNRFPGAFTRTISEALQAELVSVSEGVDLEETLTRLEEDEGTRRLTSASTYILRPHQEAVLASWEIAQYRGIVKHATGSGKTLTAIHAVNISRGAVSASIILVPSQLLLKQWEGALALHGDPRTRILLCGAGNVAWKHPGVLEAWTDPSGEHRVVISVLATAANPEFMGRIVQGKHLMLVADEVHRVGAHDASVVLSMDVGRALGLSATPERAGDPEGTKKIMDFFGGILDPQYGIRDAVRDEVLTPYYYSPDVVELTEDEQEQWNRYSLRIAQLWAQKEDNPVAGDRLKRLLIERSRVAKQARGKIDAAVGLVSQEYQVGQRWLLYCDTAKQMMTINDGLRERGIDSHVYFSGMKGDRAATLRYFGSVGGVLVSIRCLDEGVDIPAASHALLIASSRNPREFVQRRGRVLRRYPGKQLSYIYDLLVAPSSCGHSISTDSNGPLVGDLARAMEFGLFSVNPRVTNRLQALAVRYGVSSDSLRLIGFELDEESDEEDDNAS